jgi:hypothetical protein
LPPEHAASTIISAIAIDSPRHHLLLFSPIKSNSPSFWVKDDVQPSL